jgi:hypothetical protein
MALKKSVTTVYGFEIPNAYHRVEGVQLVSKTMIRFQVRSFADKEKAHFADSQHECVYDMNGSNPFNQAYQHIKTLNEFAGAIDC